MIGLRAATRVPSRPAGRGRTESAGSYDLGAFHKGKGRTILTYGLVEFSSDLTPSVIVGHDWEQVDREAVRQIQRLYGNTIPDESGGNFVDSLPYPNLGRPTDVAAWLDRLREATTEPFYTRLTETDVTVLR